MNRELKGLGGIQKYRDLSDVFLSHEPYLGTLLRGEHTSLTELASFLAPDGLLAMWTKLTPMQRKAFFMWALRKDLRVAGLALAAARKAKITLATASLQRVLVVEIIRTRIRSRNQGVLEVIEGVRAGMNCRRDIPVDPRFV